MSPRNRHQTGNRTSSPLSRIFKKIGLEKSLGIFPLLISMIALLVAWQANTLLREANAISLKQISDQLIITKIIHLGGYSSNAEGTLQPNPGTNVIENAVPDHLFCSHKIRLSNLGESATSIVNFSIRASYKDEIAFLEGFGEARTFSNKKEFFLNLPVKDMQGILISEEMLKSTPLDERWLSNPDSGIELPILVSGKSSLDFVVHTILVMDRLSKDFADKPFFIMYPDQISTSERIQETEKINEGVYPLQMTYIFETEAGQIIATNPLMCWGIGIYPPGTVILVTPNSR